MTKIQTVLNMFKNLPSGDANHSQMRLRREKLQDNKSSSETSDQRDQSAISNQLILVGGEGLVIQRPTRHARRSIPSLLE